MDVHYGNKKIPPRNTKRDMKKSAKHTSSDPLQQRLSHHHAACAALLYDIEDFVFIFTI